MTPLEWRGMERRGWDGTGLERNGYLKILGNIVERTGSERKGKERIGVERRGMVAYFV